MGRRNNANAAWYAYVIIEIGTRVYGLGREDPNGIPLEPPPPHNPFGEEG